MNQKYYSVLLSDINSDVQPPPTGYYNSILLPPLHVQGSGQHYCQLVSGDRLYSVVYWHLWHQVLVRKKAPDNKSMC